MSYGIGNQGANNSNYFANMLNRYIGETVTIFTTSGGASGCGFTGVLLFVNCDYVRLSTMQGTPPANPLSTSICGNLAGANDNYDPNCYRRHNSVGSVCDIPVQKIACFTHNAI